MRSRIHTVVLSSEIGDFADDVKRVFRELGGPFGAESLVGECSPAVDVFETDETIDIVVDLPGVESAAVRVFGKGDSVLIAGEKVRRRTRVGSSFHLVERGYGRVARVVRVGRRCDTARALATPADGELRITIPKIAERRGKAIAIPVGVMANG